MSAAAARASRHELPSPQTIGELGRVELRALDGTPVLIETLWRDRPAALAFLRHYG
ncbi:MAG: hypothetical protein ACYDGR_02070 [Candidatus Dormibacteria bacterium]